MLELLLCSLLTLLPDYLYRRYRQGRRWGHEITLYSVWFELRWGLTTCVMLTVALITVIFYFHPTTMHVTAFYRAVPVVPESNGRVAEVFVESRQIVERGTKLFRLDSSRQEAALESARRRLAEVEASLAIVDAELAAADAQILQAVAALRQAEDELRTKEELNSRNADIVARRDIERLRVAVDGRRAGMEATIAARRAVEARLVTLLPAQRASAVAALAEAQVELDKTVAYAGITGRLEQFSLRVGEIVNPFMRPAGILVPHGEDAGRPRLFAGFAQIEAQVLRPGLMAEATCVSKPWTIIPMVVVDVQTVIAAGQIRVGEQLIDAHSVSRPGTILAILEPLYPDGLSGVILGSSCIANAYTNNHDLIASGKLGLASAIALHAVDAVGIVHAMLLRVQALLLPIQTLVLSGH